MVEGSPAAVRHGEVAGTCIAEQCQAGVDLLEQLGLAETLTGDDPFGVAAEQRQSVLLALELFQRDGLRVVRVQQLLRLVRGVNDLALGIDEFLVVRWQHRLHVGEHLSANDGAGLLAVRDGRPVVLDQPSDMMGLDGSEGAAVLEALTAKAVEVVVEFADPVA